MQTLVGVFAAILVANVADASFKTRSGFLRDLTVPGELSEEPMLIPQLNPIGLLASHANVTNYEVLEIHEDPKKDKEWKEESDLPIYVQWTLAGSWVLMLSSLPFLIPLVSGKESTKTQKTIGATMLVVLLGGFYLFTNVILFQSVHFKRIRTLTMVECIYFMAQVITTVGYGDVTPAKIRGQVFVGLYVLGALFVISMLISDLTTHMVQKAKKLRQAQIEAASAASAHTKTPRTLHQLVSPAKPSAQNLWNSIAIFLVLDICWILFFALHPEEEKTFFQAVYMSVITLSTVGFGWFTPLTEAGMIFGAFWMLFGAGALGAVIGNFTDYSRQMNEYEHALNSKEEKATEVVEVLKDVTNGSNDVTEAQFIRFVLTQTKRVDRKRLDSIVQSFGLLKPQKGKVSMKAVEENLEVTKEDEKSK